MNRRAEKGMMESSPERRRFLRVAGRSAAGCLALPVLDQLSGCQGEQQEEASGEIQIALEELPDGARIYRDIGDRPIEVVRDGDAIIARSMLCTHQGCDVEWEEDVREYFCPCHDARFDAEGEVIEGPPPRPLRKLQVRREADQIVITY